MSNDTEGTVGETGGSRPPTVTFMGESAGFRNTFGMYKIADDGTIYDISILFANASRAGSGGDLIAGQSAIEIDADPDDHLGFFILSDGWSRNGDKSVFEAESYVFRDWGGGTGNIYDDTGLRLFAVDDGAETLVNARWNAATWHLHHDPETGIDMNVDAFDHVRGQLKYDGSVTVGFEDIRGGGDRDFNDVMFKIDLGDSGAYFEDKGIFDGTDQRDEGWSSGDGETAKASVTFLGETADYKNTIGIYKIAQDGRIYDVELLFTNASKYDSGGELVPGSDSVDIDVSATDTLGFFILPNGFSKNDAALFETGSYVLRNDQGQVGNVFEDTGLTLYHVNEETGDETLMRAKYGNATYHMSHDPSQGIGLNADGKDHVLGEVKDGNRVIIGFEDIRNNGDWDFDDVMIRIDLESTGARVADQNLKSDDDADQSQVGWIFETNDDVFDTQPWTGENDRLDGSKRDDWIDALGGDDLVYGGRGNDTLRGNDGDDTLIGQRGNDVLEGNADRDHLNGGSGDDVLLGGLDNDRLWGQNGDDILDGGEGSDKLWGGAEDDLLRGDDGADRLYGNGGQDEISGGYGADLLDGGGGADTLSGDAGRDTLDGGSGDDLLTGGSGQDTFVWAEDDGATDTITDLTLTGADADQIDLTALDLLDGESPADWLAAQAQVTAEGVTLDLGAGRIVLAGLDAVTPDLEAAILF